MTKHNPLITLLKGFITYWNSLPHRDHSSTDKPYYIPDYIQIEANKTIDCCFSIKRKVDV